MYIIKKKEHDIVGENTGDLEVNVDLVLCIDGTGSMGPFIEEVKDTASTFYERVTVALKEKKRVAKQLRIKVIVFRDYYDREGDKFPPMMESEFFSLPSQTAQFKKFVSAIEPWGGGDEPENGLEAVALAMQSDWVKEGVKRRHIIMVWTDASAHSLDKNVGSKPSDYPQNMPKNNVELYDWWNDPQGGKMNASAKRLILFAPNTQPWTDMGENLENTAYAPSKAGKGMAEQDMNLVLATLANSI